MYGRIRSSDQHIDQNQNKITEHGLGCSKESKLDAWFGTSGSGRLIFCHPDRLGRAYTHSIAGSICLELNTGHHGIGQALQRKT
jgi:hypothetical protein